MNIKNGLKSEPLSSHVLMYDVNRHIMYALKRPAIRNDLWLYTNGLLFIVHASLSVRPLLFHNGGSTVFHPLWISSRACAFLRTPSPSCIYFPPARRTDGLLSLANGVAKPAGILDKFYDFHGNMCSPVSAPASPLQTRHKSQPIQRGIENSSSLTTQALIRMNRESQNRHISSYSERKQTTCKLVGVYTWHGRVHLPTTGGELNKDGSN